MQIAAMGGQMLLRFEASNYRSIHQPVEFSMIALDDDRPATRGFDLLTERVLTTSAIFGPNASGKSNVLEALSWLSTAVRTSLREWEVDVPCEPFRFGDGPTSPSSFEVDLMVTNVRHSYRLEVNSTSVLFEGLYSYPERRRRMLFERDGLDITYRRGLSGRPGARELTTPTSLALSAAMRLGVDEIAPFGRSLSDIGSLGTRRRRTGRRFPLVGGNRSLTPSARWFEAADQASLFPSHQFDPTRSRSDALALLRFADLGIEDVVIVDDSPFDLDDQASGSRRPLGRRPQFIHRVNGEGVAFELGDESAGTQTWFALIGPALSALQTGQILLFDEIDASLHPHLSAKLLTLFQHSGTNPLGAQLIFTTHDTSLLGHLNRDEVWLTEKDANGATSLTALAEYSGDRVRQSTNLEKGYLAGRFGGLPDLDEWTLRDALLATGSGEQ
jgi:uncharacterized protein